jgi:hypothetical protein
MISSIYTQNKNNTQDIYKNISSNSEELIDLKF